MNYENKSCIDCALKSHAVSVLNKNELCLLEEGCSKIAFKKGELIFKEGVPSKYITYIRHGFIKLCKTGISGTDFILSISKEGANLGIQNLSKKNKANYFSAYSVTDLEVCFIDNDCFENLLKQNGEFASEIISIIFNDEMNYFERLVNNVQQHLPGRLANILLYFSNQVYNNKTFDLNLTKTELASLIGTSRESVSRMLKVFQDDDIMKDGKTKNYNFKRKETGGDKTKRLINQPRLSGVFFQSSVSKFYSPLNQ